MKLYGFSSELRAVGEDTAMLLEGRAIVFEQPTVLYEFDGIEYKEIIASTALDRADMNDVVLRYNHNGEYIVLARTRNKSLTLEKRPDGLYMKANLQSDIQSHKDLYSAVRSGLIDKMSFGFAVADGGDSYDQAIHTRTIISIRKLFEVSIVDQPAYEQTYVEARSRLEQFADVEEYRKALIIRVNLIRRNHHE